MRVLGQFRIVEHPGGKVPVEPHDDGGAAPGGVTVEAAGQAEAERTPSVPAQDRRPAGRCGAANGGRGATARLAVQGGRRAR